MDSLLDSVREVADIRVGEWRRSAVLEGLVGNVDQLVRINPRAMRERGLDQGGDGGSWILDKAMELDRMADVAAQTGFVEADRTLQGFGQQMLYAIRTPRNKLVVVQFEVRPGRKLCRAMVDRDAYKLIGYIAEDALAVYVGRVRRDMVVPGEVVKAFAVAAKAVPLIKQPAFRPDCSTVSIFTSKARRWWGERFSDTNELAWDGYDPETALRTFELDFTGVDDAENLSPRDFAR